MGDLRGRREGDGGGEGEHECVVPRDELRPLHTVAHMRWFSPFGQFIRIGHIPGEGWPLLREVGPMSYEATPSASFEWDHHGRDDDANLLQEGRCKAV